MNVLIIGKAKTGTTIISKTIENSLADTQYHLEPKEVAYFECGRWPENINHIVKIIFEHWNGRPRSRTALIFNEFRITFEKIILIVRDPRDELISRLMYIVYPWINQHGTDVVRIKRWLERLRWKEERPDEIAFIELIEFFNHNFNGNFLDILRIVTPYFDFLRQTPKHCFVIRYEDFIVGNVGEFQDYLGFQLTTDRNVGELSRTKRSASYNNWKEYFTRRDIEFFQKLLGEEMSQFGYTDWQLENVQSLNPSLYSDYVRRLSGLSRFDGLNEIGDRLKRLINKW